MKSLFMILVVLLTTLNFCCQDDASYETVNSNTGVQDKSVSAVSTIISVDNTDQRLFAK